MGQVERRERRGKWDELELRGLKRHPVKSSIQVSLISQQTRPGTPTPTPTTPTPTRTTTIDRREAALWWSVRNNITPSPHHRPWRFYASFGQAEKRKSNSSRWVSGRLCCRRGTLTSATAFAFNYEIIHTAAAAQATRATVSNENRWRLALAAFTPLYFSSHFVRLHPTHPCSCSCSTPFRIGSWHVSANDPTMGRPLTLLTQLNCRPTYANSSAGHQRNRPNPN